MRDHSTHRHGLFLLLGLALVRGLLYAAIMPPWQAPDETGHFEYTWLLSHLRRAPGPEDSSPIFERELIASLYEWRFGELIGRSLPEHMSVRMLDLPARIPARDARTAMSKRFSLAYVWQALFVYPFRAQDLSAQLFAARLSSVLINVGIVWLAFLTFHELFPVRPDLGALATALIILMPQHTFINSAVGEGPLAEMMSCLAIYGWVRLFGGRARIWPVVGIVLGTIGGIASKNTAAFLIPLDVGLALWWLCRRARWQWTWRTLLALCVAVALLALGLWVWGRTDLGKIVLHAVQDLADFSDWAWTDRRGMTLGEALLGTYDSFWANFGWMSLPLSPRWYGAIAGISAMALCGWCVRRRQETPSWAVGLMLVALLGAVLIYLWAALLSQQSAYYQFQGRYLYPAVIPFAFFLVGGMEQLFTASSRKVARLVFLTFFLLLDTWAVCGYVLPTFYG